MNDMIDGMYRVCRDDAISWLRELPSQSVDLVFGSGPYEDCREYREDGVPTNVFVSTEHWVKWMADVYQESLRVCRGLVAFVLDGKTKKFRYSGAPLLLGAELIRQGVTLRKPPIFHRSGIFGSGGKEWLRNDYEFLLCATNGGKLPWADNTACGHPPLYNRSGPASHRKKNGDRVHRVYKAPKLANPGNVIHCKVGRGHMGSLMAHENEAPFPESLAEFVIKTFCPPGGLVADPFCGSGTTLAVAEKLDRSWIGCDIRQSQVDLTWTRLKEVQATKKSSAPCAKNSPELSPTDAA